MKRIKINVSNKEREYDAYALITSYFPGYEVVTADEDGEYEGVFNIEEADEEIRFVFTFGDKKTEEKHALSSSEKDDRKKEIGLLLYDSLVKFTGHELPWGNLTGIRPTKLIRTLLEEETMSYPGKTPNTLFACLVVSPGLICVCRLAVLLRMGIL